MVAERKKCGGAKFLMALVKYGLCYFQLINMKQGLSFLEKIIIFYTGSIENSCLLKIVDEL